MNGLNASTHANATGNAMAYDFKTSQMYPVSTPRAKAVSTALITKAMMPAM